MTAPLNPWHDEKDWLVSLVWLDDKNDLEDRMRTGEEIGHLLGFANYTDTRIMAEIGDNDEELTIFQLLFSFKSEANKRVFLNLVFANGITRKQEEDYEQFTVPSRSEIDDAVPLGKVLPPDIAELATLRATIVVKTLTEGENETGPGGDSERVQ